MRVRTTQGKAGLRLLGVSAALAAIWFGASPSALAAPVAVSSAPCRPAVVSIVPARVQVLSFDTVPATVALSCAPASGVDVRLSSSAAGVLSVASSVRVRAGQTRASFSFRANAVWSEVSTELRATLGRSGAAASVLVDPGLKALNTGNATVIGGQAADVEVSLTGLAPADGNTVALSSSSAVLPLPATVTIPAGALGVGSVVFTSQVSVVTKVRVTATLGSVRKNLVLTVIPVPYDPGFWQITGPFALEVGTTATYTVTLSNPAPPGGVHVYLSDENMIAAVHVPAGVWVPAGSTRATFGVRVDVDAPFEALANPSIFGSIDYAPWAIIQPYLVPRFWGITGVPSHLVSGQSFTATVHFNRPWGYQSLVISAAADGPAVVAADEFGTITGDPSLTTIPVTVTAGTVATDTTATLTIHVYDHVLTFPVVVSPS